MRDRKILFRAFAIAIAILLVPPADAARTSFSAPPPTPDPQSTPPAIWAALNNFMRCVDNGHPTLAGKILAICGATIGQDELQCLRHHKNTQAGIVDRDTFPGRTMYWFVMKCPSSPRPDDVGVQIEKLRNGRWRVSVERLRYIILRKPLPHS
jgi:hypothetical protein